MMRFPLRGGNWNNGSNAGLGYLNLNNARSNSNSNIGFRPALDSASNTLPKGACPCNFQKDAAASANAETYIKPVDASAGCLFEQIYNFDNLLSAAYSYRQGKAHKQSTQKFFNNLEENVIALQNELMWGTYESSPYYQFFVYEPKRRLVSAPNFRDRVIHRSIYDRLYHLFDKTFIDDSYACRVNKGTHKGADRAQRFIQKVENRHGKAYALKADISKYFSSINHDILKAMLAQKVKCQHTLQLLFYIIDASPSDGPGVGIPLGNLTSQLFANIYLHELDRFVKHDLNERFYVRYMDDFIVIHHDKAHLHKIRVRIEAYLLQILNLRTNKKTQVFPIAVKNGRSLDFLGYRIYSSHRLLRKCSVKRIKTKLKKFRKQFAAGEISLQEINPKLQSWFGHASHANTAKLINAIFQKPFRRDS